MAQPYSIRIFVPGGDPDGLRTIEKSNWSGAGIVIPRSSLGESKQRGELDRTGVYVLVGPPEESGLPQVYIGEGDPIRPRLEQHAIRKDFWTSCLAFTSKDQNLNKAHVQYLEARLVALASQAKRCSLENANAPALPSLSESDTADVEGFLTEMLLCFPLLGLHVFSAATSAQKAVRLLQIEAKGIIARGHEVASGFVVRKGSEAVLATVPSCHAYLIELRESLMVNGVLKQQGDGSKLIFTQDYVFASPSTAAGVVQGRSANGRLDWKTTEGISLKDTPETAAQR